MLILIVICELKEEYLDDIIKADNNEDSCNVWEIHMSLSNYIYVCRVSAKGTSHDTDGRMWVSCQMIMGLFTPSRVTNSKITIISITLMTYLQP